MVSIVVAAASPGRANAAAPGAASGCLKSFGVYSNHVVTGVGVSKGLIAAILAHPSLSAEDTTTCDR